MTGLKSASLVLITLISCASSSLRPEFDVEPPWESIYKVDMFCLHGGKDGEHEWLGKGTAFAAGEHKLYTAGHVIDSAAGCQFPAALITDSTGAVHGVHWFEVVTGGKDFGVLLTDIELEPLKPSRHEPVFGTKLCWYHYKGEIPGLECGEVIHTFLGYIYISGYADYGYSGSPVLDHTGRYVGLVTHRVGDTMVIATQIGGTK